MWRVAIVGIDGSGKSTTALRLVERLRGQGLTICKPGRPPVVCQRGGEVRPYLAAESRAMERRLRAADATGDRRRIALSRWRYLRFVARVERQMAGRFAPELMLQARCPRVDPAVYADFYLPALARAVSLERRLQLTAALARVPARQLYLFLDTPVEVAVARIHRRLGDLRAAEVDGREHWLHLHEQPEVLQGLRVDLQRALRIVQRRCGPRVVRVDNGLMRQDGVVELMAEQVLALGRRGAQVETTAPLGEAWALQSVATPEGTEVRLARTGQRVAPRLVQGHAPAGAWADASRALVVYVEPSRTALWGLLLGAEAQVLRRPFQLCLAEPDELLCSTQVDHDASSGAWLVTYGGQTVQRTIKLDRNGDVLEL